MPQLSPSARRWLRRPPRRTSSPFTLAAAACARSTRNITQDDTGPAAARCHCSPPRCSHARLCSWHVQHEFVEAERKILGRKDNELTALAGFAGGKAGAKNGKVCYHNAAQQSDYGSLGHAEVVGLQIPPSAFSAFAKEYCALFDSKGNRPDQFGDRGGEYRNLVGVPGGSTGPYAKQLVAASIASGDLLDFASGKGSDADVAALAFVMDTESYPFFQAEPYHQFHDGFNWGEDYPGSYNNLAKKQFKAGVVKDSGCPNGLLGVGIAGL